MLGALCESDIGAIWDQHMGERLAVWETLNVRNALDKDDNVPGLKDINGNNIRMLRKSGRQFILSFEVDI